MTPDLGRRDRIIAMYQRGVPAPEIAREFGVRPTSVRAMLHRAGVFVRSSRVAPTTLVQMDRLADLMADGCATLSEAGRQLGLKQNRTDQLWQMIRKGLGSQAV